MSELGRGRGVEEGGCCITHISSLPLCGTYIIFLSYICDCCFALGFFFFFCVCARSNKRFSQLCLACHLFAIINLCRREIQQNEVKRKEKLPPVMFQRFQASFVLFF